MSTPAWWRRLLRPAPPPDGARSAEAFSALTAPCQPALFNLALALCGNDLDRAADLVQEALLRAFVAFDRFRDGSPPLPWLATILRNLWFNELGSARARREVACPEPPEPVASGPDPLDALLGAEREATLRRAIAALPPDQAEVLVLVDVAGRSYEEVAGIVGVPVGTVRSRLFRARARLADLLHGATPAAIDPSQP